ncbi:MAG: hypothetical protein K2M19_01400 [Muribaculaceae bacterium]|nr:hypothetical protein [Muribaculaceae bacterium]
MKFFKYSILAFAAVSMATGFTACSDDDNYTPGGEVNGVFFDAEASSAVEVTKSSTSFTVSVGRSGLTPAATYNVTATTDAPEGAMTFPATVTFAEGELTAEYVVAVDPALFEGTYNVSLAFGDGVTLSPYGADKYDFTIKVGISYTAWKPFLTGTGTYDYALNFLFTGDDPDLPVLYRANEEDPNDIQVVIQHLFLDQDIYMNVNLGTGEVSMPIQALYEEGEPLTINKGDYAMYVCDMYTYAINFEPEAAANFKGLSVFDAEAGLFEIAIAYIGNSTADASKWGLFQGSYGFEYFQLSGFTNANVELEYEGMYTDKTNNQFAMFTVSVGEKANKAIVGVSKTVKGENLAYAVAMGTVKGVEVGAGEGMKVNVPLDGAGKYDAAIVSFVDDEPEMYAVVSFTIKGTAGGDEGDVDWKSHGVGEITDGWITARYQFTNNQDGSVYTFADLPWEVMIEQNVKTPTLYRMVNPWSDPNSFVVMQGINEDPQEANIEIDCANPNFVKIAPQYSGLSMKMNQTDKKATKIDVGDYSFMLGEELEDGTIIDEEILTRLGYNSTLEDGVVNVPQGACRFGYDGQFGYAWIDAEKQPIGYGIIYLGDPDEQLGARQKAQKRAADRLAVTRAFNPAGVGLRLLPEGHKVPLQGAPVIKFKFAKK